MNKRHEHKAIFDEYQRLKALHPFECKTAIIRKMLGEEPTKEKIDTYDSILRTHFGILGDRYEVQERLENAVLDLWQKHRAENNYCVRKTAKVISGSLNIDERRILNLLYRNGVFGDFKNSVAVKKVAERKKTGRKPQEHKVENDPNAWSGLFKDNTIMQFSPAWYGKNIQAA